MSKLDIFKYIDTATSELKRRYSAFEACGEQIAAYLEDALGDVDETVGVSYRIKTAPSLKEKIVRNALYKQYSASKVVSSCSDIIGVRIECRFLEDENTVYQKLRQLFGVPAAEDDCFSPERNPQLALKLGTPQPERQKNGLEIYRIDGYCLHGGKRYNYELQIKSLVNSFWSEIEHKIIYKNKRFMLIDDFVNELMGSINENLKNIDRQLNMLFHRCLDTSHSGRREAVENMMLSLVNEVYSRLVEKRAGISANIKPYSLSLVKYILGYSTFAVSRDRVPPPGLAPEDDTPYAGTMVRFMSWLKTVDFNEIAIGERIDVPAPKYDTEMERCIGEKFRREMNDDFFCNTFFHILFSVEVGNDGEDFATYVRYYAHRIGADEKSDMGKARLKYEIEHADVGKMVLENEIERLRQIV